MNPVLKNIVVGVSTSAIIAAISATASVIITSNQLSLENSLLIRKMTEQIESCEKRCERMEKDVYKPSWDFD